MLYGQLSEKADVFSFGVLLLEIVSGKRNKDPSAHEDDVYLPNRVCFIFKGQVLSLEDFVHYNILTLQRLRVSSKLMGENELCLTHVVRNYKPHLQIHTIVIVDNYVRFYNQCIIFPQHW
jgi:hypothetical protein